ncbi:MAG: polyprenyl synthetase family protein [Bacteroidia bacterium]
MHSIENLREEIEKSLLELSFNSTPAELYDPVRYMLSLGGKRLRPLLVLMGCEMFNGDIAKAIPAASGIELFHNFTLLHDDIMDKSPMRRSKQTVHEKWNVNTAILSGDAMFVKSYQLMMMTEDRVVKDVVNIFSRTAIEVCEGQQTDMNFENKDAVSITDYIAMIRFKTAVLLGASLQIGALIGGASSEDANRIYDFGKNIGIAFQLQDDFLDVYGDKNKFGKQTGGDIISNKKTFLFLKAMEVLNAEWKQELKKLYSSSTLPNEEKIKQVTELFNKADVKQHAKNEMQHFYTSALKQINSIQLPGQNKRPLMDFCADLMLREI